MKFYRDKKVPVNAMKDFAKNIEEKKELVKSETYYEMDLIKKIWRYVLKDIIKYIYLDTIFDKVRTHYFVFLNHFCYGVKVSFPFYLYTSMHKNISGHKKKPTTNSTIHKGLLILTYEHFKAQSRSKTLTQVVAISDKMTNSNLSSDMEDV